MIPEYDLARLGWPNQIDRLTEMLDNVWQDHVPVNIVHNGVVVAVAVNPDDLDLLRHAIRAFGGTHSDEAQS